MSKRMIYLSGLIIFEIVADIFAKQRSIDDKRIWLAVGAIFFYIVCNVFRLFALRNGSGLGKGAMIFSVASGVSAVLVGSLMYGESFGIIQRIGIVLGIVSIALVNYE